jgi:hypothetical protein
VPTVNTIAKTPLVQNLNMDLKGLTPEWNVDNLDRIMTHFLRTGTCLLSPYPKGYEENLAWRVKLMRRAKGDSRFRARLRKLFFEDPLFAFNAFFFTLDVRRRPEQHRPFCTYPYQDLMIITKCEHILRGDDLADEKSRDMGASWIAIAVFVWFWLHPKGGYDFLLGSRIQDYVDKKGDNRTLFQKARYLIYQLPSWILPVGFAKRKHDQFMKLINPESGSTITGESNNANFGTGGRYSAILLDEFGKWKDTDSAAWTSTADATPCRMPVSTPFGAYGEYFKIISNGKTRKLTIHWSLHPLKSEGLYCPYPRPGDMKDGQVANWLSWKGETAWLRSPWYDYQCNRRKKDEIAQELDIDYIGAGNPAFVGAAAARMLFLLRHEREPVEILEWDFNENIFRKPEQDTRDGESCLLIYDQPTARSNECLGVDVAEGKEDGDYSVVKGLCRETKSCSFTLHTRADEIVLASMIEWVNNWLMGIKESPEFEPCIGIETIGPGIGTFDILVDRGVTNLFMMPSYDHAREQELYLKGWKTSGASRKKLVSYIKQWLNDGIGWVNQRTAGEFTSFVYRSANKPEAAGGANDDEVMAWGIALAVDDIMPGGEYIPPTKRRTDGLPDNVFDIESFRTDEPTSLEERCWATVQTIQSECSNFEQ